MPLDPGDFRTRLQVQGPVRLRDSQNGLITQWASFRTLSCAIMPVTDPQTNSEYKRYMTGSETMFSAARVALVSHVIYCRFQWGFNITPDMRLVDLIGNVAFGVVEVVKDKYIKNTLRIITKETAGIAAGSALYNAVVDSNGFFVVDASGRYVVAAA